MNADPFGCLLNQVAKLTLIIIGKLKIIPLISECYRKYTDGRHLREQNRVWGQGFLRADSHLVNLNFSKADRILGKTSDLLTSKTSS